MVEEHKFKKICAKAEYNEDSARLHRVCVLWPRPRLLSDLVC